MRQISASLFLFLFVHLSVSSAQAKTFQLQDTPTLIKKATVEYNKHLKVSEFTKSQLDVEGPFLKDFETHLKTSKIKNFWKAELVGDTVFFKKKDFQLKLKPTDIKNIYQISMKINGKNVFLNFKDGFTKNYELLKSVTAVKSISLWDLIIPKVYAGEIEAPEELDEALSSTLSWSSRVLSLVNDEGKVEKEKICNLNEKEKSSYIPRTNPSVMLDEIKYFIKVQNKYAKPLIQNNREYVSSGGTECFEKCQWAKEFEGCISEMALRRKTAISSNEMYGFSCFQKYEDGGIYLNSDILNQSSLESYAESYDSQISEIEHDKKYECGVTINESDRASCEKKMANRLSTLKANCPPDEKSASQPSVRSRSNSTTDR